MFAKGIAGLLEEVEDFKVVGICECGTELLRFLEKNSVDVILTDMNMPNMDGVEVLQNIKKLNIKAKIIVLSMYDDENLFKKCKRLGANAYMLKDADFDELKYTIREVVDNTHVMSFQKLLGQSNDELYIDNFKEKFKLSKREIQILRMIKDGMINREIADELHLSPLTIETHRKKIHQKLGVGSVIELVKKAMEMNL
jgi:DNA-binding NarL/FixJ family response regulator